MTKEVKKDSTQRIEYIDAMKGFSIILVVLHHVSLMAFGRNSAILRISPNLGHLLFGAKKEIR